jgi:radical SAM superfamily enzyme YgiQ (UPF0313 family)
MKVLLLSANTLNEPYPVYPLGLDYVAGAIADHHEVQIADMNTLGGDGALEEIINRFLPDVIGVSLRNIDNIDSADPRGFIGTYRDLVETLRSQSKAMIVLGGSGFTLFPEEMMDALEADYGIIGEGERMALLLDAIENRKDLTAIPGVITRQIRKAVPAPLNENFIRGLHGNRPHAGFYLKNGGMLNLQTKRGCPFKCIYCSYPHIEGRNQRMFAPTEVADTALRLQTAGAKFLFLTDSVFNSDHSHNIAVAQAFKKAGISVPWGAFFTPMKLPADYFRIMAGAGLTHVEFGTDSLSNRVLDSYGKPFRIHHVLGAHQAAIDAGLHVAHYFLLGGPGETTDTLNETLSNLARLNKSAFVFFCGIRIYPHTTLYDIAVREGQVSRNRSILAPVFYRSPSIETEEITHRVKQEAKDRPNWIMGSGGRKTANIIARLYRRGHTGPLWEYLIA